MARLLLDGLIGDWHKLIENFQTSPREFYASVTDALKRREIPGLTVQSIVWNEGGAIAPRREYLRMTDGRVAFDLCAAPFGTGFFFSWWLVKVPASLVILHAVVFTALTNVLLFALSEVIRQIGIATPTLGLWQSWFVYHPSLLNSQLPQFWVALRWPRSPLGVLLLVLAILVVLWGVAVLARNGRRGPENALMKIPVFGRVYRWMFAPVTYYALDTAIMLRTAVHAAVLEAIDKLTSEKGMRALAEDDRKPVLREMM